MVRRRSLHPLHSLVWSTSINSGATDQQVDFRQLIHSLPVPGRQLDPGDANAYRLTSGLALTCDDAEAEIASPPIKVQPGFAYALDGWAFAGQQQIAELVASRAEVRGYSTHLSVSLDGTDQLTVVDLFRRTFAPFLMLLCDQPDGFGVYLRPRPGRLELCTDYVWGRYLRAAAVFFAGSARALIAAIEDDDEAQRQLPAALGVELEPAIGRFGVYVGRRLAFGHDFYKAGRDTFLPLANGESVLLGKQMERAWLAARATLPATPQSRSSPS